MEDTEPLCRPRPDPSFNKCLARRRTLGPHKSVRTLANELSNKFEKTLSVYCVYRALRRSRYKKTRGHKAAKLNRHQMAARVKFCKKCKRQTWNRLVSTMSCVLRSVFGQNPELGEMGRVTRNFRQRNFPLKSWFREPFLLQTTAGFTLLTVQ